MHISDATVRSNAGSCLVAVLWRDVAWDGVVNVVVWPILRNAADGGVDGAPGFEAGCVRVGGVRGFGEGGKGLAWTVKNSG